MKLTDLLTMTESMQLRSTLVNTDYEDLTIKDMQDIGKAMGLHGENKAALAIIIIEERKLICKKQNEY